MTCVAGRNQFGTIEVDENELIHATIRRGSYKKNKIAGSACWFEAIYASQ